MDTWSRSRPRGGIGFPRLAVFSSLAVFGCIKADNLIFVEWSQAARVACLSLLSLPFMATGHRLTIALVGLPASFVLRSRLLQPGGAHLLLAIGLVSRRVSKAIHNFRRQASPRSKSSLVSGLISDMEVILLQIGFWYFIPYYHDILPPATNLLNQGKWKWPWLLVGGLGAWSFLGIIMPQVTYYYPLINSVILHCLHDLPLQLAYSARNGLRRRFDLLLFDITQRDILPFEYNSLEQHDSEIRILELQPAKPWEIVKATLISVPISQSPPFEAISYRWASGNEIPIMLNGHRFVVSGGVHEMLRALRPESTVRRIWLDSLCINQADSSEKGWQIGLMRSIYRSAYRVIGWLRVESSVPLSWNPLSSLSELAELFHSQSESSTEEITQSFLFGDFQTRIRSATVLLCNDFFLRTWIIQEVALARTMVIKLGSEEILWGQGFVDAVTSFALAYRGYASMVHLPKTNIKGFNEAVTNVIDMELFRSNVEQGQPLGQLLVATADFKCSDPRDRVFGILGLSTADARDKISAQYFDEITETMVSLEATRFTIMHESSFRVLELAGIGYKPRDLTNPVERPSWIPHWDEAHISHSRILINGKIKFYNTATYTPPVVASSGHQLGLLQLEGFYIDRIQTLSPPWYHLLAVAHGRFSTVQERLNMISEYLKLVEDACSMAEEAFHSIYDDEQRISLAWRTLCHASRNKDGFQSVSDDENGRVILEATRQLRELMQDDSAAMDQPFMMKIDHFFLMITNKLFGMVGRRLCITAKGYFGIVPPVAEEGDEIWAFSGSSNPFVLRQPSPQSSRSQPSLTHELVGVCYVDGIMHGELQNLALETATVNLV